tara:strand:+ start:533 stop:1093 length:561 start_codon:yes stop_codon:yes gene_type:complete
MKSYSYLLAIFLLANGVSAECMNKECMPDKYIAQLEGGDDDGTWTFYYNQVFNIGSNWFLIFDSNLQTFQGTISFDFLNGPEKIVEINIGNYEINEVAKVRNGSVSFSGSAFSEERFHQILYINFTEEGYGNIGSFELKMHVNKPPADDLFYLWGGMTVFGVAIGSYVIFLSNRLKDLSKEMEKKQ